MSNAETDVSDDDEDETLGFKEWVFIGAITAVVIGAIVWFRARKK